MPSGTLNLFEIGQRGVNVVDDPLHLAVTELSAAQNAEVSVVGGRAALDQRPGMSAINATALTSSILVVHDNPSALLRDKTATLYAGLYSGATGGNTWVKSTDGTTWTKVTTPALPFSNNSSIEGYWKNWPKCATVAGRLYFPDGAGTIGIHQFDGTNDITLTTVPPAVVGALMGAPDAPTVTPAPLLPLTTTLSPTIFELNMTGPNGGQLWSYTYKVVARLTNANSAVSTGANIDWGTGPLSSSVYMIFTPTGTPQAGVTSWDVYRTQAASGQSTGKIGSIGITASGYFTTGNGSGGPYIFTDKGLAGDGTTPPTSTSGVGTTYSYKVVSLNATGNSPLSASGTTASGYATFTSTGAYARVEPISPPIAGSTSYDVYRTAGGATTGKIGNIPIVAGAFTTGNGSARTYRGTNYIFTDAALVGDGTTGPAAASGIGASNAQGILDVLTDGAAVQFAVQDSKAGTGTAINGRILSLDVVGRNWSQLGVEFPITANGKGTAGALALFGGVFTYGTYIGTTSGVGSTGYTASTTGPLPAGIPEVKTLPDNHTVASAAVFNGELYIGTAVLAGTATARVDRRATNQSWTTVTTGPAATATSAFTSMAVFSGRLFAGWSNGDGNSSSIIRSTPDGVTWEAEYSLGGRYVVGQMVVFQDNLYVVAGRTGVSWNTDSAILKRSPGVPTGSSWSVVATGTQGGTGATGADFAGCIGTVYV